MGWKLIPHAETEMIRRQLPREMVVQTIEHPDQVVPASGGRVIHQSIFRFADGRRFLIRAVVEKRDDELFGITVYRTSKIDKYWRNQ